MTHFDSEQLFIRCNNKKELVRKLIEIVLLDLPKQLDKLDLALNENNAQEIWKVAHKIKGTSVNIGFPLLKDIASMLETSGRSSDVVTPEMHSLVLDLKKEWDHIRVIISYY